VIKIGWVNLLFLASMLLVVVGSVIWPDMSTNQMLLLREALFILAPALLLVALEKRPVREVLRLRWPGWRVAGLGVLLGAGGWLFDTWLGGVLIAVLGYSTPLPPDFFPTSPGQAVVLVLALAVVAPLCEEVLFRGVIQRGYEQRGPRTGILATGLLYVVFHQSVPQGLALIPLAFLLGYMVWRSDSLLPGLLAHAANNALAAAIILLVVADPEVVPFLGTWPAALVGAGLLVLGLWLFVRWTKPPPSAVRVELRPGLLPWLRRAWPLLIVAPLYLFSIVMEAVLGLAPEMLAAGQELQLGPAPWPETQQWSYEVRNVVDLPVGEVHCVLSPQEGTFVLECQRQQSAYKVDTGQGIYQGGRVDEQFTAHWQGEELRLLSVELQAQVEGQKRHIAVRPEGDQVQVTVRRGDVAQETRLALEREPTLLPVAAQELALLERDEWPWRLSALPFASFYSAHCSMVEPYTRREETADQGPAIERTYVVIYGAEPIKTPAGTFLAWKVQVGDDWTAWYNVEPPHTLLALEDGAESWLLTAAE
jgi:membrane protease YdiL (CAAX protease family)